MLLIKYAVVKFILLFTLVHCAPTQDFRTLELLHVFFRHGDRTPDKKDFYPSDPYKNYDFYPMGLGQLSNQGKMREYKLGTMLRNRYDDFLGRIYTPGILTARSSDYDRTKMSLLLLLAGLWAPESSQKWNMALPWQPIPISYKTPEYDYFIQRPNSYCPRYMRELENVLESNEVKKFMDDNRETIRYIETHTGKKVKRPIDLFNVYQNLNAETYLNLTLPKWTRNVYPEPLQTFASAQCNYENYNDVLKRLNGGHSLKAIIDNARAKIDGDPSINGKKIYLYSGHENNVLSILAALNVFEPHVPTYGSAVIAELFKNTNTANYEVRILYYKQDGNAPEALTVPGCTEYCSYNKFIDLTSNRVPVNYTAECESSRNLDN